MIRILLAIPILLFTSCIDRNIPAANTQEEQLLREFVRIDSAHQIHIQEEKQQSEELWLCVTLVNKETKAPLANQSFHAYHADADGEYQPDDPADESTARLKGSGVSDSFGRVFLKTTLPGDYGSSSDNRHIHTTVYEASPEGYDLHFKQYTGFMGKRFIQGSDQHFLVDLRKSQNSLIGFITIEVKL